jgi:perosamine synthetase
VFRRASRLRTFGEDIPELDRLTGWNFRPYHVFSIGWNYRHQEMPAALARSQLRRLPGYIAAAQAAAAILDRALKDQPGIMPPQVAADRTSSYYMYRVRLDPVALGLDVEPAEFRDRLGQALMAEGVDIFLWHTEPVVDFPIFRDRVGFGGGYPWSRPPASRDVTYDPAEFPEAWRLLQGSFVIGNTSHPIWMQPPELLELYGEAFRRVLKDPARILRPVAA